MIMLKYTPNWSGEAFVIKRVKNTVLWAYFISDLNVEEDFETFQEKELQKKKQVKMSLDMKK